jgi:hypothetical protein
MIYNRNVFIVEATHIHGCHDSRPNIKCQSVDREICIMTVHLPWSSGTKGNTKGGSITVPLTSCLTGLERSVLSIKTKIVYCLTADSKPVKQQVNCTVIIPL